MIQHGVIGVNQHTTVVLCGGGAVEDALAEKPGQGWRRGQVVRHCVCAGEARGLVGGVEVQQVAGYVLVVAFCWLRDRGLGGLGKRRFDWG